ncbi:EF-hand calcium-binding domain-containing protein 1-like [Haplochromis burtoni]|uniref:EF-hand calcium-binding domain-containing protein 1-like n=1 Tax=Haplochromis burtoni TaxID=8153 RepID=UPI001C2CCAFE|nr:EF-hand calcium-binding domain-containing protein 1-like [Haplochromis burtoni]
MESDNSRRAVHSLDSGRFLSILHSIFGLIDDRITVFTTFDKDKDGVVGMEEWIEGTAYCFSMYDLNGDNAISREEMLDFLKERLIRRPNEDPDEGIKDLVEIILKKMDYDLDANVSFKYFEKVVKDENLFLELFGHCLPDFRRVEVFEGSVFQEQMEE